MELMGEEVKELLPYILPILAAQNQRKMLPIYILKKKIRNRRGMAQYYLPAPGKVGITIT